PMLVEPLQPSKSRSQNAWDGGIERWQPALCVKRGPAPNLLECQPQVERTPLALKGSQHTGPLSWLQGASRLPHPHSQQGTALRRVHSPQLDKLWHSPSRQEHRQLGAVWLVEQRDDEVDMRRKDFRQPIQRQQGRAKLVESIEHEDQWTRGRCPSQCG